MSSAKKKITRTLTGPEAWQLVRSSSEFERRTLAAIILIHHGVNPSAVAQVCSLDQTNIDGIGRYAIQNPPAPFDDPTSESR